MNNKHIVQKASFKNNVLLKNLTTIKAGGIAKYFVEVNDEKELEEAVKFAKGSKLPIFTLGGGSDVLISDQGFNGLVMKYAAQSLSFNEKEDTVLVTSGAGMNWDFLVEKCVAKNFQGIECLSGIPGTVGAAPIQNIGAYGQEIKNSFENLRAYDIDKEKIVEFSTEDCDFGYRDSIFKSKKYWQKYVILNVTLKLKKNGKPLIDYDSLKKYIKEKGIKNPTLYQVREAVLEIRKTKFEDYKLVPNAGSFFKNPIISKSKLNSLQLKYSDIPYFKYINGKYKLFAGWLIESVQWKGKELGNAKVSEKHALILLNPKGTATSSEVKKLSEEIIKDVQKKFGIKLEKEVQFIGF